MCFWAINIYQTCKYRVLYPRQCTAGGDFFIAELKIPLLKDHFCCKVYFFFPNRKMKSLICLKYIQLWH